MLEDHDAYIAAAPKDLRPLLVRLRAALTSALPDAQEVIAYNMPGFKIGKSIVAGYAAFSKQCGLYVSPLTIKSHAGDIAAAGLKATKTGVTFSPSKPIPDQLVKKTGLGFQERPKALSAHISRPKSRPGLRFRHSSICCLISSTRAI